MEKDNVIVGMERIFELAYLKALDLWAKEAELSDENPEDELQKIRCESYYQQAEKVREIYLAFTASVTAE